MKRLSFRPTLRIRGRQFRGLRGWAGKPSHPPLTDIPVAAYVLAAVFDIISFVASGESWARDFYRAGSFVLIGGAIASLPTALTGFLDWLKSTEKGTQARRTASAHGWVMVSVTVLVLAGIAWRWFGAWDEPSTPAGPFVLSLAGASLTVLGAALGGTMVYDYGFNVENSTDNPVWHRSERDLLPGEEGFPGG